MKCNSDYYLGVFNETHDANEKDQEKKIVIYFFHTGYCAYTEFPIQLFFYFFFVFSTLEFFALHSLLKTPGTT